MSSEVTLAVWTALKSSENFQALVKAFKVFFFVSCSASIPLLVSFCSFFHCNLCHFHYPPFALLATPYLENDLSGHIPQSSISAWIFFFNHHCISVILSFRFTIAQPMHKTDRRPPSKGAVYKENKIIQINWEKGLGSVVVGWILLQKF